MSSDISERRSTINWRIVGWGTAGLVLLLPLVGMQLTNEVNWTTSDFLFAGLLIGAVGLVLELAVRRTSNRSYRAAVGFAAAAVLLTIWSNGAVGIIGREDNGANALFDLVPLVALLASAAVRFRAAGLSWVMLAIASLQVLVTVVVLAVGWNERASIWPKELVYSAVGFGGLWFTSARLFRSAANKLRREQG